MKTKEVLIFVFIGFCISFFVDLAKDNNDNNINFEIQPHRWCSANATLVTSTGMSMFPSSNSEGLYYIDDIPFNEIKIGDIIVYNYNNELYVRHSVIDKYSYYLYTAGYNNKQVDNYKVMSEDIRGTVCVAELST